MFPSRARSFPSTKWQLSSKPRHLLVNELQARQGKSASSLQRDANLQRTAPCTTTLLPAKLPCARGSPLDTELMDILATLQLQCCKPHVACKISLP